MRFIYSIFLYILTPFLILRLWWKGRRLPAYRERIAERFCCDGATPANYDVWVHAVSLGEVIAVTPLIEALLAKQYRLLITTTTVTGAERVRLQFADRLTHRYFPYDLPGVTRRFFRMNQIRVGIIVETELWPNMIYAANCPLLLINARLSERSCRGYQKLTWLIKPVLNQFQAIMAQSEMDARRFRDLGADASRVEATGNVKFDLNTQDIDREKYSQMQALWGAERRALILASTHHDEETQILTQAKRLKDHIPGVLILIAARHPERFQTVFSLAESLGFNTGRRSQPETLTPDKDVIILDSLGELLGFYSVSDYAFLGGSFVPVGGHNMLEAIAMQVPVLTGPQVHNFKSIVRDLKTAEAIVMVNDADELISRVIELEKNPAQRNRLIEQATMVLESNKGALSRYLDKIESIIKTSAVSRQ